MQNLKRYSSFILFADGFSTKVEAFLKNLGHKVQRADNLNAVNTAIKINETVSGQADPRRSGRSSVY